MQVLQYVHGHISRPTRFLVFGKEGRREPSNVAAQSRTLCAEWVKKVNTQEEEEEEVMLMNIVVLCLSEGMSLLPIPQCVGMNALSALSLLVPKLEK